MQMNMDFEKINLSHELLMNPSNHLHRLQYSIYAHTCMYVCICVYFFQIKEIKGHQQSQKIEIDRDISQRDDKREREKNDTTNQIKI